MVSSLPLCVWMRVCMCVCVCLQVLDCNVFTWLFYGVAAERILASCHLRHHTTPLFPMRLTRRRVCLSCVFCRFCDSQRYLQHFYFWQGALNKAVYRRRVYFSGGFGNYKLLLYVDNCFLYSTFFLLVHVIKVQDMRFLWSSCKMVRGTSSLKGSFHILTAYTWFYLFSFLTLVFVLSLAQGNYEKIWLKHNLPAFNLPTEYPVNSKKLEVYCIKCII